MNLLVDIGNTRLKWAMAETGTIGAVNCIDNNHLTTDLLLQHWNVLPAPSSLSISCVAAVDLLETVLSVARQSWPSTRIIRAQSEKSRFGVINSYPEPEKLGVDRWLAMIAGFQRYQQDLCLVDCGTAITLDCIAKSGRHLGGMIAPGLRLMRSSLLTNTANLSLCHRDEIGILADNTSAAIINGSVAAACGLVEYTMRKAPENTQLLLTGGDAETIASHLNRPAHVLPNLVLEGLDLLLSE